LPKAAGRDISYVPISIEEHTAAAAEHGVPQEVIDLLTYLFSEVLDGRNAHVADGIQRALGREPRDFREYARDAAATGSGPSSAASAREDGDQHARLPIGSPDWVRQG
jgi:hypothetical protein